MTRDWPATPMTVLTPVLPGDEPALAADLAGLPRGRSSPFRRLPGTHFARWVVIDGVPSDFPGAPWPPAPLRMHYLLYTSTFNSPVEDHVEELRVHLGAEADRVWGHCVGYPGSAAREAFHRYLAHNALRVRQWFPAYSATVAEVHRALDLRERHIALADRLQRVDDGKELLAGFTEAFPPDEEQR